MQGCEFRNFPLKISGNFVFFFVSEISGNFFHFIIFNYNHIEFFLSKHIFDKQFS